MTTSTDLSDSEKAFKKSMDTEPFDIRKNYENGKWTVLNGRGDIIIITAQPSVAKWYVEANEHWREAS